MKLLAWIKDLMVLKVSSKISSEDFASSRYFSIYNHYRKRVYKEFLEEETLIQANELIEKLFHKKIIPEVKVKLIDCIIVFLKYMVVNYDYWPDENTFKRDFDKIIKSNFEKIAN
jgi:hypothetical protein